MSCLIRSAILQDVAASELLVVEKAAAPSQPQQKHLPLRAAVQKAKCSALQIGLVSSRHLKAISMGREDGSWSKVLSVY